VIIGVVELLLERSDLRFEVIDDLHLLIHVLDGLVLDLRGLTGVFQCGQILLKELIARIQTRYHHCVGVAS